MSKKILFSILLIVLAIGVYSINQNWSRLFPRQNVVSFLKQQFERKNVPVVEIKVLQEFPLQLEFVIQSASSGEKGTPEDPINFHMVERESILARRHGYFVTRITRIFVNRNGDRIGWSEVTIDPDEYKSIDLSSAKKDTTAVKEMVSNRIGFAEAPGKDLSVSSMDGYQTLHLIQTVSSIDEANRVSLEAVGRFNSILDDLNKQGAQIVMTHVEVKNNNGDYYFNYLYDLQLSTESWWMADGFDDSWFPHP